MAAGLHIRDAQISLRDGDRAFRLSLEALTLQAGQAVALTGASGSGKTLLLELLGLLRAPGAGTGYDWVDDQGAKSDLAGLWQKGARTPELAQKRGQVFGFVPQTGGLMPFLTVAENVALPQRLNKVEDPAWVRDLLDRLGLGEVTRLLPGALSIGQRQRTAIARSLAHRPPFVIADEPTAALDPESADKVLELLLETARDQGSGVILSSHDIDRIARFGITRITLGTSTQKDGSVLSTLEGPPC
ncbi:MAG: ABC transporter ATP-binding protein [Sedimentitalea sp.]